MLPSRSTHPRPVTIRSWVRSPRDTDTLANHQEVASVGGTIKVAMHPKQTLVVIGIRRLPIGAARRMGGDVREMTIRSMQEAARMRRAQPWPGPGRMLLPHAGAASHGVATRGADPRATRPQAELEAERDTMDAFVDDSIDVGSRATG
jgi:hypothetical protein